MIEIGFLQEETREDATGSKMDFFCAGLIMFDGWEIKDDYPW